MQDAITKFVHSRISGYPRRHAYRGYEDARMVNIGAGGFRRRGWTNLDFDNPHYDWNKDGFIEYDLTRMAPLPFEDASVDLAYISHTIEHIGDDAAANVFRELWRVLRPRGLFRLAAPNADLFYACMLRGDIGAMRWRNRFFKKHGVSDPDQTLDPFDYLIRELATPRSFVWALPTEHRRFKTGEDNPWRIPLAEVKARFESSPKDEFLQFLCADLPFSPAHSGDHINWWTFEKVRRMLLECGFSHVAPSSFMASAATPMKEWPHFDSTRPMMSLYVEGIR